MERNKRGITLIALIITIIVLVILAGVAINTLYGENGIISTAQDVTVLSNIKNLEEGIDLYKTGQNLDGKIEEESYPIALNEDGSRITLSQMKSTSELAKLPDEVKYTLLNLTTEKGTTNIPSLDKIDYSKFYKLDYTKLNISQEEAENLVIYVDRDTYKVINLAGVKYKKNNVYVIIPLNNEAEPEYITVANNTYKLYGDGTLKVLGEKTTNSGYTSSEVTAINNSWDEFDLKAINERFNNRMSLPEELTSDWYASHVYFSTGTAYVIDQNNDLWAWGANDYNKLGLGHSFLVVEPTKILEGRCEGKENVKASKVWAGDYNTFIVDTEGILWACGSNSYGTLGQGNTNVYNKWVKIDYIPGNDIKEIQLTARSRQSASLIFMKSGNVYGSGYHMVLGTDYDQNKFDEIEGYREKVQVDLGALYTSYIDEDGTLYNIGYYAGKNNENSSLRWPAIIEKNVKLTKSNFIDQIFITEANEIYIKSGSKITKVNNIETTNNTVLLDMQAIIINGKYYIIDSNGIANGLSDYSNVQPYYNNYEGYEFLQTKGTNIFKSIDGKIYIKGQPNVSKIGEMSNYNLKKIFTNVVFAQGKGENISIIDRNGKIYENVESLANLNITDARKIVASSSSKYVIKNDKTLWAKGEKTTGMWKEYIEKSDYVQVTKNGIENFTNVKDIYTSKIGESAIFRMEDNTIYWAGSASYVILPGINGDYIDQFGSYITYYPKEVTSKIIEEIKDKIKDITYSFQNFGGITGNNTLILTEDGKLYTMSTNKNMSGNNTVASNDTGDFTELTIKKGTTVKQILTEDGLSLALLSNGEIYGWGYNTYGILGPNYEVGGIYPTPVKLEGLPANIRYMSLGNGFAIFASKSGEVYGIGKNDYGQLGTGDSIGRTEFVRCTKLEE